MISKIAISLAIKVKEHYYREIKLIKSKPRKESSAIPTRNNFDSINECYFSVVFADRDDIVTIVTLPR